MTATNSKSENAPRLSITEWRARKQARREKQRLTNVGRALKMHAARVACELPLRSTQKLPKFIIGCSGWFYWHWRGSFYPRDLATKEWYAYYAKHFPTVELNAPFYSWPTVNTVKTWLRLARKRKFIYTVKVCELITHVKHFNRTQMLVKDFGFIAGLLGSHMGCFLFQLPPSFHYTPARLKRIVAQLDSSRRNVVEFRHRSWWNPKVYAAFRKNGVIFCSSSAPNLPDELIATADEVYIRFHGATKWYRHDYTPADLCVWVQRIKASGCKRVWANFNNDRDACAIKNAKELTQQLKRAFRSSPG